MGMTNKTKRNKSTFKKGYKRSPESIEKQRQTIISQLKKGVREKPPAPKWTEELIKRRTDSMRKTKLIKNPIGSKKKHRSGKTYYWTIKVASHGKWPYEHRVIMEEILGRPLGPKEFVHHINGDGLDNRAENLKLMSHSEHSKHHGYERVLPDNTLQEGFWSKKFASCIICGTTSTKHVSKGRCNNCYHKIYRRFGHK